MSFHYVSNGGKGGKCDWHCHWACQRELSAELGKVVGPMVALDANV